MLPVVVVVVGDMPTSTYLRIDRRSHRTAAAIVTSNRDTIEWLALMADPLFAHSAIDRLQAAADDLVLGRLVRTACSRARFLHAAPDSRYDGCVTTGILALLGTPTSRPPRRVAAASPRKSAESDRPNDAY